MAVVRCKVEISLATGDLVRLRTVIERPRSPNHEPSTLEGEGLAVGYGASPRDAFEEALYARRRSRASRVRYRVVLNDGEALHADQVREVRRTPAHDPKPDASSGTVVAYGASVKEALQEGRYVLRREAMQASRAHDWSVRAGSLH